MYQDSSLRKRRSQEGTRNAKNTPYKYRRNNKYNKIHDFGKGEAKRGPEMAEISQKSQK